MPSQATPQKSPYRAPALIVYGNIRALTASIGVGTIMDGASGGAMNNRSA